MTETRSDEQLMAAYTAGEQQAFEALFRRLAPRVHGVFLRSFRSTSVADDLVQATFLKVHRLRESYDPGRPFRAWLFTIAASLRRDELRRRYRLPEHADEECLDELIAAEPSAVELGDRQDVADAVRAALGRLPESQRVVLHLNRFEGLTLAEVAAALGTTPTAVRVRASRAYETLRVELAHLLESDAEF